MSLDSSQPLCPRCQFPVAAGDAFCRECGLRLSENSAFPTALSAVSQPLPARAEGTASVSEFFVGPELDAIATAWGGAPPQPSISSLQPPEAPTAPLPALSKKPRRKLKKALLVLAVVLVIVLGTGGGLAYIFTRTNPVIQVNSAYDAAATPVGAATTSFHITGQQFLANTSITFLLDGKVAPGVPTVHSDDHGNLDVDVTATSQWTVGNHTLAARDDLGNTTKEAVPIMIVVQGLDGTPGPNGAPADDDSFSMVAQVDAMNASGDLPKV